MKALQLGVIFTLMVVCFSSLSVPGSLLSPLGVPSAMGPSGLVAVKLAVGTQLLNILGLGGQRTSIIPSPLDNFQQFPFLGQNFPPFKNFPESYRALSGDFPYGMTPKSKEFSRFTKRRGPNIPTTFDIREATASEVENFFGVLDRVDANKCISRLVCEIGADPKVLEGLGHNVKDIISSLRVLEKNKMSKKYRDIMSEGQKNGKDGCQGMFVKCDARSYRLIKTFVRAFRVKRSQRF